MAATTRSRVRGGALGLVLAAALAACGESEGPGSPDTPLATEPAATATSSPTVTAFATPPATSATTLGNVPVYWVGESRKSFALYREFRTVPNTGGPISSAVAAMTRLKPLDPDYLTPWRPASKVTVSQTGDAIKVDLSSDAFANRQVGSELAERAIQQLVYTATAAAQQAGNPARTVTITADGKATDAWGAVRLGEPTARAPMADVQAHAWVTSPQEGQRLAAGKVTFTGFGTSFEATFGWKVQSSSGAVVAKGSAMGGTGDGKFGTFTFTANLTPGSYSVEVSTDDASGGAEGPGPAVDDKTFTVR